MIGLCGNALVGSLNYVAHVGISMKDIILGLDLDNTLIDYDSAFLRVGIKHGFFPEGLKIKECKKSIRDAVRALPDGEVKWQKLQFLVYGPEISNARVAEGFLEFFEAIKVHASAIYIVSHKTEYAAQDTLKECSLRDSAMEWLESNKILTNDGGGIHEERIFFCNSRTEKVEKIKELGCTHFVDDLPEVFDEVGFPELTKKILYSPGKDDKKENLETFGKWKEIQTYFEKNL